MSIEKAICSNKSKDCYERFVDFGEDIGAYGEDDTVATQVFMVSALRSYWIYQIGYVLIDKMTFIVYFRVLLNCY